MLDLGTPADAHAWAPRNEYPPLTTSMQRLTCRIVPGTWTPVPIALGPLSALLPLRDRHRGPLATRTARVQVGIRNIHRLLTDCIQYRTVGTTAVL